MPVEAVNAFSDFYCNQAIGSNINSGSTQSAAADYTSTNGNWNGTTIFTPTDGTTPASTISVGMFASIFIDGATLAVYVVRIASVAAGVNGAIVFSSTAKSGTPPSSSATGRSIKVGGCWKGPNAAEVFPFNFVEGTMRNTSSDPCRVNFKNNASYVITAAISHNVTGPVNFQGYTTQAGDGGYATLDGGTSGTSYTLLTMAGANCDASYFIFQNNGATGTATGVAIAGSECTMRRCVVTSIRGIGLSVSGISIFLTELEAYGCNQGNSASGCGLSFATSASATCLRLFIHDNTGSNSVGVRVGAANVNFNKCIFDTNASDGVLVSGSTPVSFIACEFYNNGGDGLELANTTSTAVYLEDCNFFKNIGWGYNGSGAGSRNGMIINCAFGSGTMMNTLGPLTGDSNCQEIGTVNFDVYVTPWIDPSNGDFRINHAASKNTGTGSFLQTQSGYAGTVGRPDRGAAQHTDAATYYAY